MSAAYLWELCDALGTERWRRRVTRDTPREPARPGGMPFVSLHVPAHNEPPEMVIQTLTSLLHLEYPSYEFVVIDDNTDDEQLWRPVADWCTEHGVTFFHLADWPGYKSGALNVALREYTDPRAELVGVVDSDYQLAPDFLRRCAPLFADDRIGFIQAPQDYPPPPCCSRPVRRWSSRRTSSGRPAARRHRRGRPPAPPPVPAPGCHDRDQPRPHVVRQLVGDGVAAVVADRVRGHQPDALARGDLRDCDALSPAGRSAQDGPVPTVGAVFLPQSPPERLKSEVGPSSRSKANAAARR